MSCKYLQSFIDSISSWLLFVTVVWMVAVGETKLIVEGQLVFSQCINILFHTCNVAYSRFLRKSVTQMVTCLICELIFKTNDWKTYKLTFSLCILFILKECHSTLVTIRKNVCCYKA